MINEVESQWSVFTQTAMCVMIASENSDNGGAV